MSNEITLSDLMSVVQGTAMNVSGISEQMGLLNKRVNENSIRLTSIEDRMQGYEDRLRLDRNQARRVKGAIHARVDYLLGIEKEGGVVTKECLSDDRKYRGKFLSRCYHDARTHSHLGTPYTETYQKDYQIVMEYIATWEPEVTFEGLTGVAAYKLYLDARAIS